MLREEAEEERNTADHTAHCPHNAQTVRVRLFQVHFHAAVRHRLDDLQSPAASLLNGFAISASAGYPSRLSYMRFWKTTLPIATPIDWPKERKKLNMATTMVRFSFVEEACTPKVKQGNRILRPRPGTMLRNIHPGILVPTSIIQRSPSPRIDRAKPSQIAHRYPPVMVTRIPITMALGATVKDSGRRATTGPSLAKQCR